MVFVVNSQSDGCNSHRTAKAFSSTEARVTGDAGWQCNATSICRNSLLKFFTFFTKGGTG